MIILDPSGIKEKKRVILPSVPVFITSQGQLDVDHRILACCRDGKVYIVKGGEVQANSYDIESKPVGVVQLDKSIIIAGMNKMIHSFYSKGKKNFSIYLPCPISCIAPMEMTRTKSVKCVLVALNNGEVRMYNGKTLISVIKTDSIV